MSPRNVGPLAQVTPWFVPAAVEFLDTIVCRRDLWRKAFEWGAGLSTVWLAARFEQVVTVESESGWITKVRSDLTDYDLQSKVELIHRSQEAGGGYYLDYAAYLQQRSETFDLISVDGRNRVGCLALAASRVRKGGLVILDNSDRPAYLPAWRHFSGWTSWTFWQGQAWATTIWSRPQDLPDDVWVKE